MPQLDPATFPTQIIWLAITFIVLFLVMWRVALPRVAAVLATRQSRIDDDLDKATKLKDEAQGVLAAYEKAMAEARAQAQATVRDAGAAIAAEAAKRHGELAERLAEQIKSAEDRIANAKAQAVANIGSIASDAVRHAAARLVGTAPDEHAVSDAVAAAMKSRQP